MGDSETVVAQSSAIQEHPSTTVNRDLAASTGIDTMDVDNVIPHEDDQASIQILMEEASLQQLIFTPFSVGLFFVPESPRWLAKIGRKKEFDAALRKLRGKDADISEEADEIQDYIETLQKLPKAKIFDLFQRRYLRSVTCTKETHRLVDCETVSKYADRIVNAKWEVKEHGMERKVHFHQINRCPICPKFFIPLFLTASSLSVPQSRTSVQIHRLLRQPSRLFIESSKVKTLDPLNLNSKPQNAVYFAQNLKHASTFLFNTHAPHRLPPPFAGHQTSHLRSPSTSSVVDPCSASLMNSSPCPRRYSLALIFYVFLAEILNVCFKSSLNQCLMVNI
ncbi:unnamed protein product [Lactuca saligna]|uniref:Uncharacterized protein n=1 Tax=Lactuca saligna TaxID=75948 RepID=A0AA35YTQ7_LACSI|nr:unnamed protein product [Lactuca saligna]